MQYHTRRMAARHWIALINDSKTRRNDFGDNSSEHSTEASVNGLRSPCVAYCNRFNYWHNARTHRSPSHKSPYWAENVRKLHSMPWRLFRSISILVSDEMKHSFYDGFIKLSIIFSGRLNHSSKTWRMPHINLWFTPIVSCSSFKSLLGRSQFALSPF